MRGLFWNLALALAWVAVTGDVSPGNLSLGFGLGFLVLVLMRRAVGVPDYGVRTVRLLGLLLFFGRELIAANLRVAYEVLTPALNMRPAVIAVPLDARTDLEITLLANMITLTPGTLSLDVSADRATLYVHAMYGEDPAAVRRAIKDGFERRLLEVLR
ncbi:MAG: Na+/H+ antiporter subunit E [Chloroflexales bacterium]|nr:Na+/H+ antiporter subunit E [Chloroflexales bacterium]